jgi:hypothetical protein
MPWRLKTKRVDLNKHYIAPKIIEKYFKAENRLYHKNTKLQGEKHKKAAAL